MNSPPSDRTSNRPNDACRTKHAEFVPKEMKESVFRYKKITDDENLPLQHYYFGNYCKNAAKRLPEEDEEEQEFECVIMDYDHDRAMAQIKLSHKMGIEYALEVLHVDNKNESNSKVKVIYRPFENTVSGRLQKLEKLAEASEINKQLKNKVIPIIRKLWKLLGRMEEKKIYLNENNNQGYWMMPLISDVPLVFNLCEGEGNPDRNFPVAIIEKVLDCNDKSLRWLESALKFWRRPEPSLYYAGKHPALYDSAEKSRFLALFFRCTVDYGLAAWLDQSNHMNWPDFRRRFDGKKSEKVYEKILNYRAPDRYRRGSDIVWYTRNALAHFEDNYKDIKKKPWDGGEIVEILDEDLAVCSLHYTFAKRIIESQPPKDLTKEGWEETRATKWNKLKAQARARARPQTRAQIAKEVLSEAYQPARLEIYTKNNDWDEGWKPVTEEILANTELLFKTDRGWKKGSEVFNGPNQPPLLWTNEAWRKGWRKGWREDWKEAREIEVEAYQTVPPEFYTDHGLMTITKIIGAYRPLPKLRIWDDAVGEDLLTITEFIIAEQPPILSMWRKGGIDGGIDGWIEAFEVDRPRKFIKPENWEKAREKLKDFLDSLK